MGKAKPFFIFMTCMVVLVFASETYRGPLLPGYAPLKAVLMANPITGPASDDPDRQPLYIALSVLWEGEHLEPHNLRAIRDFRRKFSSIPLIHFINPAYFARDPGARKVNRAKINSIIRAGDETGLHLVPWKSLVRGAGLKFKGSPTFWGYQLPASWCRQDCGKEVLLSAYGPDQIRSLLNHHMDLMQEHGFGRPRVLHAAGWMATPGVLEGIAAAGLRYDLSGVTPATFRRRLQWYPLYQKMESIWQDQAFRAPGIVDTRQGSVIQVSHISALADYLSADEILEAWNLLEADWAANPRRPLVFHLSFHQETAMQYLPRVSSALQRIFARAQNSSMAVRVLPLPLNARTLVMQ